MTIEKLEKANFIKDKINKLIGLSNLIGNLQIDGFDNYLGIIRHIEDVQHFQHNGDTIIKKIKITEDIQDKLLNIIQNELSVLEKEFQEL